MYWCVLISQSSVAQRKISAFLSHALATLSLSPGICMYWWWFPRSIFLALLTLGSSFSSSTSSPVVGAEPSSKEVVRRWTLSSSVYCIDCGGGVRRGCIIVFASFCAPCDDGARVRQLKNNSEISVPVYTSWQS